MNFGRHWTKTSLWLRRFPRTGLIGKRFMILPAKTRPKAIPNGADSFPRLESSIRSFSTFCPSSRKWWIRGNVCCWCPSIIVSKMPVMHRRHWSKAKPVSLSVPNTTNTCKSWGNWELMQPDSATTKVCWLTGSLISLIFAVPVNWWTPCVLAAPLRCIGPFVRCVPAKSHRRLWERLTFFCDRMSSSVYPARGKWARLIP